MAATLPRVFTVSQVAKALKVTENTIYRNVRSGKIQAIRVGRAVRITQEQLDKLLGNRI